MLFKAILVVRQTYALVPKAKPPRDGENLRFFLTKSAPPATKEPKHATSAQASDTQLPDRRWGP